MAEFYKLIIQQFPNIDPLDVSAMSKAATRYAKQIIKGKAAELFGLSLETAIQWLKDPEVPMNYKRDIIVKVLGHAMPQNITLNALDVEGDEGTRPIVFSMARPAESNSVSAEIVEDEFVEHSASKKIIKQTHG